MTDGNNRIRPPMRARAIVMKCSDETYMDIQRILRDLPDCYVVYSKSSNLKLVIKEEGW
jgi:hypothetical protein